MTTTISPNSSTICAVSMGPDDRRRWRRQIASLVASTMAYDKATWIFGSERGVVVRLDSRSR